MNLDLFEVDTTPPSTSTAMPTIPPTMQAEIDQEWDEVTRRVCYIFGVKSENDVPAHLQEEFEAKRASIWTLETQLERINAEEHAYRELTELNTELRHRETMTALDAIGVEVKRSNVVSAAIDFAGRHPFLAGFFGNGLLHKIRGR